MKRVITWGIRYRDYESQRELFSLVAAGEIEIVAETAYIAEDPEIFGCRMATEDAFKLNYDVIVYSGNNRDEVERCILAHGISFNREALCTAFELSDTRNKNVLIRQVEIIKEIVGASDSQIFDKGWLSEKIYTYGTYPFFKLVKRPQKGVVYSTNGILQVPDEFVDFCLYISKLKCQNAIEIGVARGGSSYVMAALLYRNNSDLVYDMVDIEDNLVNFEEMKQLIPALNKKIPSTSADYIGKHYDFCFIDADHSYSAVMEDYRNVGQYSGMVTAYHDVFGHEYDELEGGTVRGWKEIKELENGKEIKEFSRFPDKWMGIGVVVC